MLHESEDQPIEDGSGHKVAKETNVGCQYKGVKVGELPAPLNVLLAWVDAPVVVPVLLLVVEGPRRQGGCQKGDDGGEYHGEPPPLLASEESGGVADMDPAVGGGGGGEEAGEEGDSVADSDTDGTLERRGGAPVVEESRGVEDYGDVGQPQEAV